jgi:hypothetical protein
MVKLDFVLLSMVDAMGIKNGPRLRRARTSSQVGAFMVDGVRGFFKDKRYSQGWRRHWLHLHGYHHIAAAVGGHNGYRHELPPLIYHKPSPWSKAYHGGVRQYHQ